MDGVCPPDRRRLAAAAGFAAEVGSIAFMTHETGAGRRARAATAVLVVAAMAALTLLTTWQAGREERPLGQLDPIVEPLRSAHGPLILWLEAHAIQIAEAVTAVMIVLILAAWLSAGRRVMPIVLFGFSLSAATWGEALLLTDRTPEGFGLLAAGAFIALLCGVWFPLPAREAFSTGSDATPAAAPPRRTFPRWELALVGVLVVGTFVSRLYALDELPQSFEVEMILSMLATRSWAGVVEYTPWGMVSNSNGIFHLFLQLLSFEVLGTSVFSLRFTSALWWTAAVPLFYWLVRHMAGTGAAVIGTVLLISAPEQVYWSRCETTCIALLTPVAIVSATLTLLFVERKRGWVLIGFLVWLPISRLFYTPVIIFPIFAVLLYLHELVFARGQRGRLLLVLPILALACVTWFYSMSLAFNGFAGRWQFLSPVSSGGAVVWRGEGAWRTEDVGKLLTAQATNLATNLQGVVTRMTYRGAFNNWYTRSDPSRHPTTHNVGFTVVVVVGIGYLLGQLRDRRAFALLLWAGLGLLPAVMSLDPAPRRMGLSFSAFAAIAAVTFASALHYYRSRTRRGVAWAAACGCAVGLVGIAWTSVGSHFALPIGTTYLDAARRLSAPAFTDRDAVIHTLPQNWSEILSFVHGDEVYRGARSMCTRAVSPQAFLPVALQQTCDFDAGIYRFALWPEQLRAMRETYDPQRVSYLVNDGPETEAQRALLKALFPEATTSWLRLPNSIFNMEWFPVDRPMLEEIRTPTLTTGLPPEQGADLADRLLSGARLRPTAVTGFAGVAVDGGLLIERDGWYSIAVDAPCEQATLTVEGRSVSASATYPFTKGVHQFTLALPGAAACSLPLQLKTERYDRTRLVETSPRALFSQRVAALPAARGRGLITDSGVKEAPFEYTPRGHALDIGADASGVLAVLSQEGSALRLAWVRRDGSEERAVQIEDGAPTGMSVAPDGTVFLVYTDRVLVRHRDGSELATWPEGRVRSHALGHLPNGQVLSPMMEHHYVNRYGRRGKLLQTWRQFEGGPGYFRDPVAVYTSPAGDILVLQVNGIALWFRTPPERFVPAFVSSFRVEFFHENSLGLGGTIDDRGQLILPDPQVSDILRYELDGDRVLAADPVLDPANVVGDLARRVVAIGNEMYVVDGPRRLRRFVRVSDANQS